MLDVEDRDSIRKAIRSHGDVIVDATAPFQKRTATLVDEAIAAGADVVDLSDSLGYARLVWTREGAARDRGVRVLSGCCSSVSVLSAFAIVSKRDPQSDRNSRIPRTRDAAHRQSEARPNRCLRV